MAPSQRSNEQGQREINGNSVILGKVTRKNKVRASTENKTGRLRSGVALVLGLTMAVQSSSRNRVNIKNKHKKQ